jgi:hypothetical protein
MRKSNFLKKSFSFVGTSSPHFLKRLVTFNITAFLILGSIILPGNHLVANAQGNIEVSASSPDSAILAELTSLNYRIDNLESLVEEDVAELQDINTNVQVLSGVAGHIFGAVFLLIAIIVFIAIYKLLNIFFRF